MNYTLQNQFVSVTLSSVGGELISMKSADGTEYVWTGDPKYWPSHAPHLFPYVGRLTNGRYIMDGEEHEMYIHGRFRQQELNVVSVSDTSIVFSLSGDTEGMKKEYDRHYITTLRYDLKGTKLLIHFEVENQDGRTMYFGYGGHPGFNVPLASGLSFEDYFLEFEENCQPVLFGLSKTCYLQGADIPLALENDRVLPLRHSLFDNDALVLRGCARAVTIRSEKDTHAVKVSFPAMPYLGIWHAPKTEAPYVCIEPWVSVPSRQDIVEVFEEKHDLVVLAPGKTYTNDWSIEIF